MFSHSIHESQTDVGPGRLSPCEDAMRLTTFGCQASRLTGALLMLLAFGLVAPPRAQAGCSHYVTSRSQAAGVEAQLELLSLVGTLAPHHDKAPTNTPERHIPCTGAMCSGNPAVPLAPVSTEVQRVGQWAMCAFPAPPSGPGSVLARLEDSLLSPSPIVCSIFHPPRVRESLPVS
jgi:hypothetical protein